MSPFDENSARKFVCSRGVQGTRVQVKIPQDLISEGNLPSCTLFSSFLRDSCETVHYTSAEGAFR